MTVLNVYLISTTVVFFFLGVIWEKKSMINLFLKMLFIGLSVYGTFQSFEFNGYLFRVAQ